MIAICCLCRSWTAVLPGLGCDAPTHAPRSTFVVELCCARHILKGPASVDVQAPTRPDGRWIEPRRTMRTSPRCRCDPSPRTQAYIEEPSLDLVGFELGAKQGFDFHLIHLLVLSDCWTCQSSHLSSHELLPVRERPREHKRKHNTQRCSARQPPNGSTVACPRKQGKCE